MRDIVKRCRCLSRNCLKMIAVVSMIIDHLGKVCFSENSFWWIVSRSVIGRLAFPLFGFLFIDGCLRTKRPWRHFFDLVFFMVLSEPGYDRLVSGSWCSWECQSIMVAWVLIWYMIVLLKYLYEMYGHNTLDKSLWVFGSFMVIVVFAIAAGFCKVDYDWCGPIAIGLGLMIYYSTGSLFWCGTTISIITAGAYFLPGFLLAIPIYYCYDEKRICSKNQVLKYLGYAFYPVHLTVIGFVLDALKLIPPG